MASPRPEISVITPSLDQASFLERAIESVSASSDVAVEHIVVDGGSTDGSITVLERHAGPALRWISERDRGQSEAFNKGLALATAPIIGWLNADDIYTTGALASVVRRFAADPDVQVVYGDTEEIDEGGCVRRRVRAHGFDPRSLLLQRFALYHPAIFYRRDVFERIGPVADDLHLVMDFELALRISRECRIGRIDAVLARHRTHPASKSARGSDRFASEYLAVLDRVFADPRLPPDVRALRAPAYQAVHLDGAVRALRAGDRRTALQHLRRSLGSRRAPDARTLKTLVLMFDALTGLSLGRLTVRGLGGHA